VRGLRRPAPRILAQDAQHPDSSLCASILDSRAIRTSAVSLQRVDVKQAARGDEEGSEARDDKEWSQKAER
jgi:hypothetical protein